MSAPLATTVSCSQCGGSFGPGTEGYSHCAQHAPARNSVIVSLTIDDQTIEVSMPMNDPDVRRLIGPMSFRRDELLDQFVRYVKARLDNELLERHKQGAAAAHAA